MERIEGVNNVRDWHAPCDQHTVCAFEIGLTNALQTADRLNQAEIQKEFPQIEVRSGRLVSKT
jgi:hypothetical protein